MLVNRIKYLSFLFVMVSIYACSKELPIPDIEDDPLLVVNSLFSPEGEFLVHVSESCHLTETNCKFNYVNNAIVSLLDKDGQLLANLEHQSDGIYTLSGYVIGHDTEYHIEVSANELKSVRSKTYIPKLVNCNYSNIREKEIAGQLVWAFDIEIEDDPEVENYYIIEGSAEGSMETPEEFFNDSRNLGLKHFSDDANSDNNEIAFRINFIPHPLKSVFLSDKNFNGKTYNTTVGIDDENIEFESGIFSADTGFGTGLLKISGLKVKSVSKDMYEYMKSLETLRLVVDDPFVEPIQVPNNIEDGIGIFAGFTEREFEIELPVSEYRFPSEVFIENDGCTAPCIVKLSADGGTKLTYRWDLGDGNTSDQSTVEHTYSEPGVYAAFLFAERENGDGYETDIKVTIE